MNKREVHIRGFTLIELAIVLAVLSLMVAGVASVAAQKIRRQHATELQSQMDTIEKALQDFRQRNNRLPCPADLTYDQSSQYFGVEGATAGTCTTGAPAANFTYTSGSVTTAGGMVPVRTLGLPDGDAYDPWGGEFYYVVDTRITGKDAFTTYTVTDDGTRIGSITVMDGSGYPAKTKGQAKTTSAVALIMSAGENGHGAYQFGGGGRKSFGSTNSDEQQNCHCNSTAQAQTFDNIFVQHPATITNNADASTGFDDVVRYYMRSSFLSIADTSSQ